MNGFQAEEMASVRGADKPCRQARLGTSFVDVVEPHRVSPGAVRLSKAVLLLSDLAIIWAVFLVARLPAWMGVEESWASAFVAWWGVSGSVRLAIFGAISFGIVLWFWAVLGHYSRMKPYWDEVREVLVVLTVGFMIDAMAVFIGKWDFSRLWLLSTWTIMAFALPVGRLLVRRYINDKGWFHQPYVIIGCGQEAKDAAAALESEPLMGFRLVAVVNPSSEFCQSQTCQAPALNAPTFELNRQIESYLKNASGLHIVVAMDNGDNELLKGLSQRLSMGRDDVFVVPPLGGLPLHGMELLHFFSHEVLVLRSRNNLKRRPARWFKRACDIVGSLLLLIMLAPLFLFVAIAIKREGGGACIFSQSRVGFDGKEFKFLKFRSMVANADAVLEKWKTEQPTLWAEYRASNFKLADDPRVTKIGKWIRKTSIDELPQLLNVLRGDMSLVGPRPLLPRELGEYGDSIEIYNFVRPGITGLWQISGRSETTFEQRIAMDRWYIKNWTLWNDLVILIRTVKVVLRSEGAY